MLQGCLLNVIFSYSSGFLLMKNTDAPQCIHTKRPYVVPTVNGVANGAGGTAAPDCTLYGTAEWAPK